MAIRIKQVWINAQKAIKKAQMKIAEFVNAHQKDVTYQIGDRVFLSIKNIETIRPSKKLNYKIIGSFKIVCEIGGSYKLNLPELISQKHLIFHLSLLRPARADPLPN